MEILCCQVLPFVFNHKYSRTDSLVVVVSQLVSLMADQVDGLRQKGVKAAIISPAGACPEMRKGRCAREARPQNLFNIHLFVKLRHFRHYYHGSPDLFIAELMG